MRHSLLSLLSAFSIFTLSAAIGADDDCAARWRIEGIGLGEPMPQVRSTLEASGATAGRATNKSSRLWLPLRRADGNSIELGALGRTESVAVIDRLTFVRLSPEGGGDAFLTNWQARWGDPTDRTTQRDGDSLGAMSEAWIWLDPACDVRAIALVRREITPRGARLRYGTVQLQRLSSLVKELDALERTADRLAGL